MIVTVGNTKGGVGKTTLALHLAIARARAGRDVWLVDGDRQATALTAVAIRDQAGQQPPIACANYPDGSALRSQVRHQAPKYQDVVIDAGGRDSASLRAALSLTDVLLVPLQPRSYDVWSLDDIVALIDEALAVRNGLPAYAVLNVADPGERSRDNTDAAAAVAEAPQLTYLETPIRRRKAFATAAGAGLSVLETSPRDAKAAAEITALTDTVFSLENTITKRSG